MLVKPVKRKSNKTNNIIIAIVGSLFLICGCLFTATLISPPAVEQESISTIQPTQTATVVPNYLTCSQIYHKLYNDFDNLTWAQYHLDGGIVDAYIQTLVGKKIYFSGTIDDVIETVFINDTTCDNKVGIVGIKESESILLNIGDRIEGFGTVDYFSPYQIIQIKIDSK